VEKNLNNIFNSYSIKAECISYYNSDSYIYYDCYLKNDGKISSISEYINEIQLKLKLPNINIRLIPEDSIIRIESFLKRKDVIYYDNIKDNTEDIIIGLNQYSEKSGFNFNNCPHILIGGASGSGKSVLINTIIKNCVDKNYITYVCDLKNEHYNSKAIVLNDLYKIKYYISSMCDLMESRYSYKDDFNRIVFIIDEYADLSMQDENNKVYKSICRLAQKSRAANINLVLATQRPSTNFIKGEIKANFSTRIALKTASAIDSRIIIDEPGAEQLFGKGDAIIKDSIGNKERFQVAI